MSVSGQVEGFGLGCVKLGSLGAGGEREGVRLVHRAVDLGVSFFDTADAYGDGASERVLGRALRGRRDGVTVATKGGYLFGERSPMERAARRLGTPVLAQARRLRRPGDPGGGGGRGGGSGSYAARDFSTAHLRAAVDRSLQRLGTDRIDLFQLHGPPAVCEPEVAALMADLRAAGKIRGFGVGLESLEHALAWLDVPGLDALQLPFGVLDPEARERVIPAASERGVRVIARAVFAAGLLNDPSPDAVAVLRPAQRALQVEVLRIAAGCGVHPLGLAAWFARDCAGVSTVLVGASSQHHLQENLALFRTPRPADEAVAAVESAIRAYERRRDAASGGDAEGRAS